jgi:positive regulator of sigma E activity
MGDVMNFRVVLSSGIMTALVGMMIGLAISHISQREERKTVHIVGGAVVGFLVGAGMSTILQQRQQQEKEYGDTDEKS